MSLGRAASWLGLLTPASAVWALIAWNLPGGFVSQLDRWQTLLGGFLAIGGAFIGGAFIMRQVRSADRHVAEQLARRNDADRAMLPLALSEIGRYARECASALSDLVGVRRVNPDQIIQLAKNIPTVPSEAVRLVRDLIESTSDPELRGRFSFLLNKLQVQSARLLGIKAEGRNAGHIIQDYYLDAVEISALCSGMFDFARRESETVPPRVSAKDMLSTLNLMGAYGSQFDEVRATAVRRASRAALTGL